MLAARKTVVPVPVEVGREGLGTLASRQSCVLGAGKNKREMQFKSLLGSARTFFNIKYSHSNEKPVDFI